MTSVRWSTASNMACTVRCYTCCFTWNCSWPTPPGPSRHQPTGCLRAVEGGDLLPMDLEPLHHRRLRRVVDADDLEQPEKELAMASLWSVPDALGGYSDAADATVGAGSGLGAMSTSGGAVGKDGDTRCDRAHTQRLPAVPSQVPAQPVVEVAKSGGGMDLNRLALNDSRRGRRRWCRLPHPRRRRRVGGGD
jgi:hypothetical protein